MTPHRPAPFRARRWFTLRWPSEVATNDVLAALHSLNGYSTPRRTDSLVLTAVGRGGQVTHQLGVPAARTDGVQRQLEAALDGLSLHELDEPPAYPVARCWRAWIHSQDRPLDTAHTAVTTTGLITALTSARDDETLVMRWVLGPVQRPSAQSPAQRGSGGGFASAGRALSELLTQPIDQYGTTHHNASLSRSRSSGSSYLDLFTKPVDHYRPTAAHQTTADPEALAARRQKQGMAGWRTTLHIGVDAVGRHRQRQLLGQLAGAVRAAQNVGAQPGFRRTRRAALNPQRLPVRFPLRLNVDELAGLTAWPVGSTINSGVDAATSRLLLPADSVGNSHRLVAHATHPRAKGNLTLSAADARQHLHVLGPTGVGKSTLLLNLICQDMAAGRSVVVIEPRGDLVNDVLARVPSHRANDVVVLDPTDPAPVGLNPLAVPGVPNEVKVDHLITVFRRLWADFWGPRSQDILTAGLLTLTATPGMSLVALPLLYTDYEFRQKLLKPIRDPFALGPFWSWYDAMSEHERAAVIAPVMNKLRAFLLRLRIRRVLGQARPRFDMRAVYERRPILLVNLATGSLGPESSALLGSLTVSLLWQTLLGRNAVPVEHRHPVLVYIDEFQTYLHLPTDLAEVLAQARGLGIGLTLAHQHMGQLPNSVQAAVLANARSKVVFATSQEDAAVMARGDNLLKPADIANLASYEIYASLVADNYSTPFASGRTLPPPAALRCPQELRDTSRARWGTPAGEIDDALQALVDNETRTPSASAGPLGQTKRSSRPQDPPTGHGEPRGKS